MGQSILVLCLIEQPHKLTSLGRSNKDRLAKEMLPQLTQARRNLNSQWANILKPTHYIDSVQPGQLCQGCSTSKQDKRYHGIYLFPQASI